MEKVNLSKEFGLRLREAMIAKGFHSQRSTSGVCIHKLAEFTGYSVQICRKYLRGEAIPEPLKLMELALKLQVSPGWLLFGSNQDPSSENKIILSKNTVQYIFSKAQPLFSSRSKVQELTDFLLALMQELSLIDANEEQSKKIIDLAIASAEHFKGNCSHF